MSNNHASTASAPAPGTGTKWAGADLAERVAAAAGTAPMVVGLHGGPWGGEGTYLPGRMVTGVRIDDNAVTLHLVGLYGHPVADIAADARRAVAPLTGNRVIHVVIEDLA